MHLKTRAARFAPLILEQRAGKRTIDA